MFNGGTEMARIQRALVPVGLLWVFAACIAYVAVRIVEARIQPDGDAAPIVEQLEKTNELLRDMKANAAWDRRLREQHFADETERAKEILLRLPK